MGGSHFNTRTHLVSQADQVKCSPYLTFEKTMSTSVRVMALPSMTPQSLHNLDQFLPCISFPVARVSPWMANRLKASSSGVSSTGVLAPAAPSLVPFDSVERRLARSLE